MPVKQGAARLCGEFSITPAESLDFALLSGDFNPLHLDPVYSRRLQFGGTVVHGVHSSMKLLDFALQSLGLPGESRLGRLSVSFHGAVRHGQTVSFIAEAAEGRPAVKITASVDAKRTHTLTAGFEKGWGSTGGGAEVSGNNPPRENPIEIVYPPRELEVLLPLFANGELLTKLFPHLEGVSPYSVLAQILTTTRCVGMRCPGLHSLLAGLQLEFHEPTAGLQGVRFAVESTDDRYRRVTLGMSGDGVKGKLDTFVRPGPVRQRTFSEVQRTVSASEFADQRALVVGGSRGAGEATAKLLAAGGADVVLTFCEGRQDAARVRAEIECGGGRCRELALNVLSFHETDLLEGWSPTHVYYFATPAILPGDGGMWNEESFQRFCDFYVRGFLRIVELTGASLSRGMTFVYPSSNYVENPDKAYSEYAVAKTAGEALCRQLQARFPRSRFVCPRLPRMQTDQTSGILAPGSADTLIVLASVLRGLRSSAEASRT